jgi:hypothetical protein
MDVSQNKAAPAGDLSLAPKDSHNVAELEYEKETGNGMPVTSAFATLPRLASIRKFWRLFLFGLGVSISGM